MNSDARSFWWVKKKPEPEPVAEPVEEPAPDDEADYSGLTKAELIGLATDRGLATGGNKPDLIARLEESDAA